MGAYRCVRKVGWPVCRSIARASPRCSAPFSSYRSSAYSCLTESPCCTTGARRWRAQSSRPKPAERLSDPERIGWCATRGRLAHETERAGFEPAMEFDPHTRLAGECLQPLGHLSREGDASVEPAIPARGCSEPRLRGIRHHEAHGRVAERLNAAVLKTVRRANPVSGVRIPPLPLIEPPSAA